MLIIPKLFNLSRTKWLIDLVRPVSVTVHGVSEHNINSSVAAAFCRHLLQIPLCITVNRHYLAAECRRYMYHRKPTLFGGRMPPLRMNRCFWRASRVATVTCIRCYCSPLAQKASSLRALTRKPPKTRGVLSSYKR